MLHGVDVAGVEVLLWNPRIPLPLRPRRAFRWTRHLPVAPRVSNVGDLLGPEVVRQQVRSRQLRTVRTSPSPRLAAVGSVFHMLPPGAAVWGAGVNGKHLDLQLPVNLDIRAVRGPLTGRYLVRHGYADPGVYGDPALLLDIDQIPERRAGRRKPGVESTRVLCLDNLNDVRVDTPLRFVRRQSPRMPCAELIAAIEGSSLVIGSSLHALVLAELLGVPARAVFSAVEPPFKYHDYYEGTGRAGVRIARNLEEALTLGGVQPGPLIGPGLRESFPEDLWVAGKGDDL